MKKNILILITFSLHIACTLFADSLFLATDPITGSVFTDRKARRVGDLITVYISETSNTAQSASKTLSKKSSLEAAIQNLFFSAAAATTSSTNPLYANERYIGSRLGAHRGAMPQSNWETENDFEGDGAQTNSNTVTATISAMIIEVLPNGNFIIEGERAVTVDEELQTIMLSGLIRPGDIGADNSVLSKNIANAKISIEGKGPISKYKKRGWLKRIWDVISWD